jgi:polyribonucleotide nucleotidyltransferase
VGDGKRVEKVEDFLNVGDKVEVEIAEIDGRGKIYLDKVRPEGSPAPAADGDRPSGRDRGDRGPRDRGDRSGDRERGERGPGRSDRGSSDRGSGEGGDGGGERRRRIRDR